MGRRLLEEVERRLRASGCRKANLLIEPSNARVQGFYEVLGYARDELIFMEQWLAEAARDEPSWFVLNIIVIMSIRNTRRSGPCCWLDGRIVTCYARSVRSYS